MISGQALRERTFVAQPRDMQDKALLFVDIDRVISLPGSDSNARPAGAFHNVDAIIPFPSSDAAAHLLTRADGFDLVSCSGWEEKAEEHLPHVPALPAGLPFLSFPQDPARIDRAAGASTVDVADRAARAAARPAVA